MKRLFLKLVAPVALSFALFTATVAIAGPATDVVKEKQSSLFKLLQDSNPDQAKIASIFDEMLDYDALAESSLGGEWANLSADQKSQFTGLLKQLVQHSYENNLKKTLEFDVQYTSEDSSNSIYTVNTKAIHKHDPHVEPIDISYKLTSRGSKFKIVDIVTEGVSLVDSYKSQFVKVIKKDGFSVLVQKMKDKIAAG